MRGSRSAAGRSLTMGWCRSSSTTRCMRVPLRRNPPATPSEGSRPGSQLGTASCSPRPSPLPRSPWRRATAGRTPSSSRPPGRASGSSRSGGRPRTHHRGLRGGDTARLPHPQRQAGRVDPGGHRGRHRARGRRGLLLADPARGRRFRGRVLGTGLIATCPGAAPHGGRRAVGRTTFRATASLRGAIGGSSGSERIADRGGSRNTSRRIPCPRGPRALSGGAG